MRDHTHSAVILDRDGTIIYDKHYLACPDEVELLPFAAEALRLLQKCGLRLFVTTNQSGIGRGYFTLEQMHAVNARLESLLAAFGVHLDGIYYCPHAPDTACTCRKPRIGMIERILSQTPLRAAQCYVVGDKHCDIALGHNAQMQAVLVRTGYGARDEQEYMMHPEKFLQQRPHYTADNLLDAAQWITTDIS